MAIDTSHHRRHFVDSSCATAPVRKVSTRRRDTSLHARVVHADATGSMETVRATPPGTVPERPLEDQSHWLCPIEDRREMDSERAGILAGFTFAAYLRLVDWTSRLFRHGKATVDRHAADIMTRLGTTADRWQARLCGLLGRSKLIGHVFGNQKSLEACKANRGVRYVKDLAGRPA